MSFRDAAKQREYRREWLRRRRADFLIGKTCARCGATGPLEVDHIDPEQKISHHVWSWSESRRTAELAKCQTLCVDCHKAKTRQDRADRLAPVTHGSTSAWRRGCRCQLCRAAARTANDAWRARVKEQYGVSA